MNLSKSKLLLLFADYNIDYFESELPIPEFKIIHSYRTLGEYCTYPTVDGHYGDVISITDNYDFTEEQLRDVFVHEMMHMYLMHFGIDKKCSHGKAFKDMMNDFNIRYGLNIKISTDVSRYKLKRGKSKFMQALSTIF